MLYQVILFSLVGFAYGYHGLILPPELGEIGGMSFNTEQARRAASGATEAYLGVLTLNGRLKAEREFEAWNVASKCLESMSEAKLRKLSEWQYLSEFIELQITRTTEYEDPLRVLKRLIPIKFWDILKRVPYPVTFKSKFRKQKLAAIKILQEACSDIGGNGVDVVVPGEVKSKIRSKEIKEIFAALLIDGYTWEATNDAKMELESTTGVYLDRLRFSRKMWIKIAEDVLKEGSTMNVTCLDEDLEWSNDRTVLVKLREIATDLGVTNCVTPVETPSPVKLPLPWPTKLPLQMKADLPRPILPVKSYQSFFTARKMVAPSIERSLAPAPKLERVAYARAPESPVEIMAGAPVFRG